MKYIILSSLIGMSVLATGTVTANADTFQVHGYETNYGR